MRSKILKQLTCQCVGQCGTCHGVEWAYENPRCRRKPRRRFQTAEYCMSCYIKLDKTKFSNAIKLGIENKSAKLARQKLVHNLISSQLSFDFEERNEDAKKKRLIIVSDLKS